MGSVINDSIGSFSVTSDNQTITGISYTLPEQCFVKGTSLGIAADSEGNIAVMEKVFSAKRTVEGVFITQEDFYTPMKDNDLLEVDFSLDVSGDDIRVRIKGVADSAINWRCEMMLKIVDFSE